MGVWSKWGAKLNKAFKNCVKKRATLFATKIETSIIKSQIEDIKWHITTYDSKAK